MLFCKSYPSIDPSPKSLNPRIFFKEGDLLMEFKISSFYLISQIFKTKSYKSGQMKLNFPFTTH